MGRVVTSSPSSRSTAASGSTASRPPKLAAPCPGERPPPCHTRRPASSALPQWEVWQTLAGQQPPVLVPSLLLTRRQSLLPPPPPLPALPAQVARVAQGALAGRGVREGQVDQASASQLYGLEHSGLYRSVRANIENRQCQGLPPIKLEITARAALESRCPCEILDHGSPD